MAASTSWRGGGRFNFMYAEAFDLFRFVLAVSEHAPDIFYSKQAAT